MKKSILLMMAFTVFYSCQSDNDKLNPQEPKDKQQVERKDIQLTEKEKEIVQKNNVFAFNLLRTVSQNEKKENNILISPLSATLALAMLNNGAEGNTHKEIQQTLGYGDISRDEMNGYFQKMISAMEEIDPNINFKSANSIWIENTFPVLAPFKEVNSKFYDAEIRNEDFSAPSTLALINNWCSDKTEGKIPEILEEISSNSVMYLINALYFKGIWTVPFDKKDTKDEKFNNLDGSTPVVPTMYQEIKINYSYDEEFAIAELPYGNEAFSMVLLLPHRNVSLSSVVDKLNGEIWENSSRRISGNEVILKIPRFKIEYKRDLKEDLKLMGMKDMFNSDRADFTPIHPTAPLLVSKVLQKTFAEINEEGTEAAAVTAIEIAYTSIGGQPSAPQINEFIADRPFLYLIKEKSTGAIFFMGEIRNLSAN